MAEKNNRGPRKEPSGKNSRSTKPNPDLRKAIEALYEDRVGGQEHPDHLDLLTPVSGPNCFAVPYNKRVALVLAYSSQAQLERVTTTIHTTAESERPFCFIMHRGAFCIMLNPTMKTMLTCLAIIGTLAGYPEIKSLISTLLA